MGIRVTALQFTPSVEVLYTKSFVEQFARKRQSSHTTQIVPVPSIAAEGSGPLRIPPASRWVCTSAIVPGAIHVVPPSVELKVCMTFTIVDRIGTTTVPLGCTRGWPPIRSEERRVG